MPWVTRAMGGITSGEEKSLRGLVSTPAPTHARAEPDRSTAPAGNDRKTTTPGTSLSTVERWRPYSFFPARVSTDGPAAGFLRAAFGVRATQLRREALRCGHGTRRQHQLDA